MQQLESYPALLKVEDVQEIAQLPRSTVYYLVKTGAIPAVRLGRRIRIPRAAIEELLNGEGPPLIEKQPPHGL
jgi:excisionase family DNA binding protein